MKALHCEMCGGSDVVKSGEYFVCQSCGTKYTVEEAKKMMSDETGDSVQPASGMIAPQPGYEKKKTGYAGLILSIIAFILAVFCTFIWITFLLAILTPSSSRSSMVATVTALPVVLLFNLAGIGVSIPGWILSAKNETTPFFAAFALFALILVPLTVFLYLYLSALSV